jgi:hypothetical protein
MGVPRPETRSLRAAFSKPHDSADLVLSLQVVDNGSFRSVSAPGISKVRAEQRQQPRSNLRQLFPINRVDSAMSTKSLI